MNFVFENITQKDIDETKDHLDAKRECYSTYLSTSYWSKLSKIAKLRDGGRCKLCDSELNLNVHHRSYRWKANPEKEIDDLVTLCEDCHSSHHGKKTSKTFPKRRPHRSRKEIKKWKTQRRMENVRPELVEYLRTSKNQKLRIAKEIFPRLQTNEWNHAFARLHSQRKSSLVSDGIKSKNLFYRNMDPKMKEYLDGESEKMKDKSIVKPIL
jgi:hypothetical protein